MAVLLRKAATQKRISGRRAPQNAKKQSRSKRTLIGRVDEATGEIVPTDGRGRKRSPNYVPSDGEYVMPKTVKELKAEVLRLLEENSVLRKEIQKLKSKRS